MHAKTFTIMLLLGILSGSVTNFPQKIEKLLKGLKVYNDSISYDTKGYGNCNVLTNGEYLIIKSFVKKGDIVFDVGAYHGEWSQLVLNYTKNQCIIYAFEPIVHSYEVLKTNVGSQVQHYNFGLSNMQGSTTMNYFYHHGGDCSSLYVRHVLAHVPVKLVTVQLYSLDAFCHEHCIEHIDFLKIDTEGNEWKVLQGAQRMLSQKRIDTIQFEYGGTYPDAGVTLYEVYTYLVSQGYAIFRIVSDGLVHIPTWRKELENARYSNYLALLQDPKVK